MTRRRRLDPPPSNEPLRVLAPIDGGRPRAQPWQGVAAEEQVVDYLTKLGWRIEERNFRCRRGEIDIIALDGQTLVFVEVKARSHEKCGHPGEAVNALKQGRLQLAARVYLAARPSGQDTRFDVVTLLGSPQEPQIEHCRSAF